AEYTMKARFDLDDEEEGAEKKEIPYQPSDFLRIHRGADTGNDLYTTMNVVQENAIRGGISRRDRTTGRRHTTRQIRGIDQNVRVNRLLWQFSQELLKFKKGE
ncbi:MAG: DUF932 domain-containing protein, partial [Ktedonobacteraceae bacterium]|nr:DUF932 domain-containing protein [Ktedonobacteraceae bacterium]